MRTIRRPEARITWLSRQVRGLRPDRNPLRRRCDRVEAAVVAALLAFFLGGGAAAALAAGHWAYAAGLRTAAAQQKARHQERTVTLQQAAPPSYAARTGWEHSQVQARWSAPDGAPRTGLVTVAPGTPAGTTVTVWTDASGQLASAPLQRADATSQAVLAGILACLALALPLLTAGILSRQAFNRRRLAGWEAEWSSTGPHWTGRR